MAKAVKKETFGWAYEYNDGSLSGDVFPTKSTAAEFADNYQGYKLVKVTIKKYVKK